MDPVTLTTARLLLRPVELTDAPDIQRYAAAREVALNTLLIPHPYPEGGAEEFIHKVQQATDELHFAVTLREDGSFIGMMSLLGRPESELAEIGYWIAVPYWGHGYATEAAAAVIGHGFEVIGVNRIYAAHFARNPASGRVMVKNGMKHEGTLRQHLKKWDELVDLEFYGILRSDFKRVEGA